MNKSRGMSLVLLVAAMALLAGGAQAQPDKGSYVKGCYVVAAVDAKCPDNHTWCGENEDSALVCVHNNKDGTDGTCPDDFGAIMRECGPKPERKGRRGSKACLAADIGCPDNHTECGDNTEGVLVCKHEKDTNECPDLNGVERVCGTKPEGGKGPRGSKGCYVADVDAIDCPDNHTRCGENEDSELVCIYDKNADGSTERCPTGTDLEAVEMECGALRACALPVGTDAECPEKALSCSNSDGATICVKVKDAKDADCNDIDADDLNDVEMECGDKRKGPQSEGDGPKPKNKKQHLNRRMQL
jgi:hypothetical protein